MHRARSKCVPSTEALSLRAGGCATFLACGNWPRKSPTPLFRDFVEASLRRHDWSSHGPLMIKSISSLSSLRRGQGVEAGSSYPVIMTWFFWRPAPTLKLSRDPRHQSSYEHTKRYSCHSRESKDLKSSWVEEQIL